MTTVEKLRRENDALRKSISTLNSASLRISASLDLETVLHEVVESACALTQARHGAIATMDQGGSPSIYTLPDSRTQCDGSCWTGRMVQDSLSISATCQAR